MAPEHQNNATSRKEIEKFLAEGNFSRQEKNPALHAAVSKIFNPHLKMQPLALKTCQFYVHAHAHAHPRLLENRRPQVILLFLNSFIMC